MLPVVTFEAIYEPMLTSFWSLISFAVQLYIIMQYNGQHHPLLSKNAILFVVSPAKAYVYSSKFFALNSSVLDRSFLEWRLGCKTCIVYTGLYCWYFFIRNLKRKINHQDLLKMLSIKTNSKTPFCHLRVTYIFSVHHLEF